MKIMGVMKYHWRRRWFLSMVFCLGSVAIMGVMLAVMFLMFREVTSVVNAEGQIVQHVSYTNLRLVSDSRISVTYSGLSFLVFLFSLAILNRDRRFLVSLSVPRYQILLGSFLFLVSLALALAVLSGLILPALTRLVMMGIGFPVRGGWSATAVLTGNNINMGRDVLLEVCSMICTAGVFTLLGYVFLRWWKILLILGSAFIVAIILLVAMINWESMLSVYALRLADWLQWLVETWLPRVVEFFRNPEPVRTGLIQLGVGVGCSILSYPVMRGMKVS